MLQIIHALVSNTWWLGENIPCSLLLEKGAIMSHKNVADVGDATTERYRQIHSAACNFTLPLNEECHGSLVRLRWEHQLGWSTDDLDDLWASVLTRPNFWQGCHFCNGFLGIEELDHKGWQLCVAWVIAVGREVPLGIGRFAVWASDYMSLSQCYTHIKAADSDRGVQVRKLNSGMCLIKIRYEMHKIFFGTWPRHECVI